MRNGLRNNPRDIGDMRIFVRRWYGSQMRRRIEIPPHELMLVLSAAGLLGLVYAEGWIWPLKMAAVMIPVSLLVG